MQLQNFIPELLLRNFYHSIDGRFMHKQRSCFPKIHFFYPPSPQYICKNDTQLWKLHWIFPTFFVWLLFTPGSRPSYQQWHLCGVGLNSRLDHEIFVRRTRKWRKLRYTNWMKINNWHRLKVNTSFGFLMTFCLVLRTISNNEHSCFYI